MIHKVERLISVGKFRNYNATGPVSFNKLTLIYADNGSGKTTLASVLRSLTENKPEIVRKRISTNHTNAQAAQIVKRDAGNDTHHTLRSTGWSNPFPNIEIFDIHFVNENIYSGFDFSDDHKKQLHHFVVGIQGIAIKRQIEQNKIDKATSKQIQETIIGQIIQQVGNGLTVETINPFLTINIIAHNNIANRITLAQTALTSAIANSVIQQLQGLTQITTLIPQIDFPTITADLLATTQTIQDTALQTIFEAHHTDLNTHGIEEADKWLSTGFDYLERKKTIGQHPDYSTLNCPFCQQSINNNIDIIKAYLLKFNEEFNSYIGRLQLHLTTLQAFNAEVFLQGLTNTNLANTERVNSWSTHLPVGTIVPTSNVIANQITFSAELQALIASIQQKIQNPSLPILSNSAALFQSSLLTTETNIDTYNQNVLDYNVAITIFKNGIITEVAAQAELALANRINKRFAPAIDTLCNQLTRERQTLRTLETSYTQLTQQEATAATAFFTSYKDRINYYLRDIFNTPFLIDNVVHVAPQGRATQSKVNYKLTIDGLDISFDPEQNTNAKDCLSEGDKSTLALAFFMAKLDIDSEIADKIIIFDDPLSSFDNNRRLYTVQLIKGLLIRIKQLIVLSHNEFFLFEIYKDADRGLKQALRIAEDFTNNTSKIEPLDIEKMVEIDYFRHLKELEDFLTSADIMNKERILGLMRNVLEAHIRFKFYRQTLGIPENQRTFGRLIDELVTQGISFRDSASANIISKLRLINNVSCKPHHGEPVPNYNTIGVDPATITVRALADLVQDTLNLVDNQL